MTKSSYSSAGNYIVTLTVTDNDGATDTETESIIAIAGSKGDFNRDSHIASISYRRQDVFECEASAKPSTF